MIKIMDCTLRDGANVVGKGFDTALTTLVLEGLLESNITIIELGNALGIGAYAQGSAAPMSDDEYLALIRPYTGEGELGMFMGFRNGTRENIGKAKAGGLSFLRVGANAGDGKQAAPAVERVKEAGLFCRYSLMKAYLLPPGELAEEAAALAAHGVDEITIMDSAGAMTPAQTAQYVKALKGKLDIPVAFHGHNNLGLAVANALAAVEAGADVLDACLMGMARSAGNIPTEIIVAFLSQNGGMTDVDLWELLTFIDHKLLPAMREHAYHCPIPPLDLILGLAGAHSSFTKLFETVSGQENVDLYKLIVEVSKADRKAPSENLLRRIAKGLKA